MFSGLPAGVGAGGGGGVLTPALVPVADAKAAVARAVVDGVEGNARVGGGPGLLGMGSMGDQNHGRVTRSSMLARD